MSPDPHLLFRCVSLLRRVMMTYSFFFRSKSGLVNIYGEDASLSTSLSTPKPLKTLQNLTTSISTLRFNHDSQLLAVASSVKKDQMRLVRASFILQVLLRCSFHSYIQLRFIFLRSLHSLIGQLQVHLWDMLLLSTFPPVVNILLSETIVGAHCYIISRILSRHISSHVLCIICFALYMVHSIKSTQFLKHPEREGQ